MHFDIKDLKLFLGIREEGSITRAAYKAYMTAVAGSVRLRNLEQSIKLRLLYRSSKAIA
ncbi:LysR family transcriptional regulator, partial [Salmonella enterica subsp. enterica serovar Senftenberg]|uniref:helix-turn-helix domain-containing protein n=1 Tax=Salmonella enterica TaxID=28901 RepID=UPI0011224B1E